MQSSYDFRYRKSLFCGEDIPKGDESMIPETCVYHHSATAPGYVSRRHNELFQYKGTFGKGYVIARNHGTILSMLDYYIEK